MGESMGVDDDETRAMNRRLGILLAMAMFVLVVDTSIMNVSISSVVRDLDTTVSGVLSAIALEALVSAAFILIGSKVRDLSGIKLVQDAPCTAARVIPIVPRVDSGWYLVGPLVLAGSGLGLLVSQLNNYTLAPISEERVSEAAGVNSEAGSFGLSFGLAFASAIMLATLSVTFTAMANDSTVLPPSDKERVAVALEEDAQVMTNTQLTSLLESQPPQIRDEIVRINTESRPIALQVALSVPIIAALLGLVNSFRMSRLPDIASSSAVEGLSLG